VNIPVLVTGGSGFIASHLIPRLVREGKQVRILDLFPPPMARSKVEFVQGDVRDVNAVRRALAGCTEVYHLAAAHHDVGLARDTYFDVNVNGTRVLCETMHEAGVRDLCFTSTVAVYGGTPAPRDEEATPSPSNPYGQSKLDAEGVVRLWAAADTMRRALVIRPSVVFGPDNFANMYALIRQIQRRLFVPVGRGDNVKSVVYVENLIDAIRHLWGQTREGFHLFNVVDKPDPTSEEITRLVYEGLGRRPPVLRIPLPVALAAAVPFEMMSFLTRRTLPVSRFRIRKFAEAETQFEADRLRATGFQSKCSTAEGLRRTVAWVVQHGSKQAPRVHLPPATPVTQFAAGSPVT